MLASEREGIALLAKLFQGFGDRSRLEILLALDQDGALTVSEIMERTELGQSNASSHLACLRECGLVRAEQQGRNVRYEIAEGRVQEILRLSESLLRDVGDNIYACTRYRPAEER